MTAERKVRALLNKLTAQNLESISRQIIDRVNDSKHETDGTTLTCVIKLIFERATDEGMWIGTYAQLCKKASEGISPEVKDYGTTDLSGRVSCGGPLFRKRLLGLCQDEFERFAATMMFSAERGTGQSIIQDLTQTPITPYSDEYFAAEKTKRQRLGLLKFLVELLKNRLLTERIVYTCVGALLKNVDNPSTEQIESLWHLLVAVGPILSKGGYRSRMDVDIGRMAELAKGPKITPRMQFLLLVRSSCLELHRISL